MDIALYISNILKGSQDIALPNFGIIYKAREYGRFDTQKSFLLPPRTVLRFKKYPNTDTVLIKYLADAQNLSSSSAEYFINQYVELLAKNLQEIGEFPIPKVGIFRRREEVIVFESDYHDVYDHDYFGLPILQVGEVEIASSQEVRFDFKQEVQNPVVDPSESQVSVSQPEVTQVEAPTPIVVSQISVEDIAPLVVEQEVPQIAIEQQETVLEPITVQTVSHPWMQETEPTSSTSDILTYRPPVMPQEEEYEDEVIEPSEPPKKKRRFLWILLFVCLGSGMITSGGYIVGWDKVGSQVTYWQQELLEWGELLFDSPSPQPLPKKKVARRVVSVNQPLQTVTSTVSTTISGTLITTENLATTATVAKRVVSQKTITKTVAPPVVKPTVKKNVVKSAAVLPAIDDESEAITLQNDKLQAEPKLPQKPKIQVETPPTVASKDVPKVLKIRYDIISQSFVRRTEAQKHLKSLPFKTTRSVVLRDTAKNLYRVCVGSFKDKEAAESALSTIPPEYASKLWIMEVRIYQQKK